MTVDAADVQGPRTTTTRIRVLVPGRPAPQGSKRHVGNGIMIESSKAVKPWRQDVREQLLNTHTGAPLGGPLYVDLLFLLPRPKGHYRTGRNAHLLRDTAPRLPAGKPDIDKLARAVLDAIGSAGTWGDDAQVTHLSAAKRYADGSQVPGVWIEIEEEG